MPALLGGRYEVGELIGRGGMADEKVGAVRKPPLQKIAAPVETHGRVHCTAATRAQLLQFCHTGDGTVRRGHRCPSGVAFRYRKDGRPNTHQDE